jgi:hypothetical protein
VVALAAAFSVLLLLGQARLVANRAPAAPAADVAVVHAVLVHAPVWIAMHTLRPRGGHTPTAMVPGVALVLLLLLLIGAVGRRIAVPTRASRTPDVRGPPRVAI